MRFAFVIFRYFPYGGVQRDCLAIAEQLMTRGHEVAFFTRAWDGPPPGAPVHLVPASGLSNYTRDLSFTRGVAARLHGFDAVVGFNRMPGLDIHYAADPCFRFRQAGRWGGLYQLAPRYRTYSRLEESVFSPQGLTQILFLTERQRREYVESLKTPAERFHAVPPGISRRFPQLSDLRDTRRRAAREPGDGEFSLLLVASDFKTKGLDRGIRALAALPPSIRNNVRLVAAGSNDHAPYMRLARRLGVHDRLTLMPPQEDIEPLLLAADILIHPSRLDTTGTVILEAVASGLPVLCTGTCGYAEHVTRAQAGVVLPHPFKQDALNAALAQMLHRSLLDKWSESGAAYGRTADLYRGRDVAADLIEKLTAQRISG